MAESHRSGDEMEDGELERTYSVNSNNEDEEVLEEESQGVEFDGDECVKYGSQGPLVDRQFGVTPTLPHGETRHPDGSQTTPITYDQMLKLCKEIGPAYPQPIIPILFYGYVQAMTNPEEFYLLPDGLRPAFNQLSVKLQQFYGEQQHQPNHQPIDESKLRVDLPCVAKYEGEWYRAKITQVPTDSDDGTAEVFFVDWGNFSKVPPHEIFALIAEFGVFPPMALYCREHGICRVYKSEAIEDWKNVLWEIGLRVKVEMFTTKEPPYTVSLFIHPCARSPLTKLITAVLDAKPSKPDDITEEKIELALNRIQFEADHLEKERKRSKELETHVDSDDEFELFCGLPPMTDEEYVEQKMLEFNEAQEERKRNRRRQRTGPSKKVQMANARIADLRAQGKGPAEFIDWETIKVDMTQCEIYFDRARPQYQIALQSEKTRPWFGRSWNEMFVSFVNGPRELYLHGVSQLRTIKHMTESMAIEYSDVKYSTPEYMINEESIIPGFVCAIKNEHSGLFVRGLVTEAEKDHEILIKAVDFGWMFPPIPWSDRARLKPLRASGQLEATPCAYTCKLRLACQLRQDTYVRRLMRRLVQPGTVWHVFFEDRKVGPPFRVYMNPAYGPKFRCTLKDIFAETYQQEKGMAPTWRLRTTPYLPLGEARNRMKVHNRWLERQKQAQTFQLTENVVESHIMKGNYNVLVTQIDNLQHFYVQLYNNQTEIVQFGNNLNAFYQQGMLARNIRSISANAVCVGQNVVTKWSADSNYYRCKVMETLPEHIPNTPKDVQIVRVRFMDYGNVSDYMPAQNTVYPLIKTYHAQPMWSLCCCLKGFQPDKVQLTQQDQIRLTRSVSHLFRSNERYHATIEPTEQILYGRRLHLVTLKANGRSINEEMETISENVQK